MALGRPCNCDWPRLAAFGRDAAPATMLDSDVIA